MLVIAGKLIPVPQLAIVGPWFHLQVARHVDLPGGKRRATFTPESMVRSCRLVNCLASIPNDSHIVLQEFTEPTPRAAGHPVASPLVHS